MQYRYCSIRDVIGRVIRNTGIQSGSEIPNIHEWVFEAMQLMGCSVTLQGDHKVLTVQYHKAKLPCELEQLDAVQYKGYRLAAKYTGRPASMRTQQPDGAQGITVFQTASISQIPTVENHIVYSTTLTKVDALPCLQGEFYYTEMGVLNTSFESGEVIIYFRKVPLDQDGMPLIPDNMNFKTALYWYCRAMMIGAGYQDAQFSHEMCMHYFENVYGPRALAEIDFPSPDQVQSRLKNIGLLPNAGYYQSFFE